MSSILTADHLAEQERIYAETEEMPEQVLTFADVVESGRRIRYFDGLKAVLNQQAQELLDPLLAEIKRIEEWRDGELKSYDRRSDYHRNRIIAYYRLNPPAKGKTIKFPGGKVSARDGADRWLWQNEREAAETLQQAKPDLVRNVPQIDKNAVKEAAKNGTVRVEDGQVYLITADGEKVLLPGVIVEEQPTTFKVEVEEGERPPFGDSHTKGDSWDEKRAY